MDSYEYEAHHLCVHVCSSAKQVPRTESMAAMDLFADTANIMKIFWFIAQLHHPVERGLARTIRVSRLVRLRTGWRVRNASKTQLRDARDRQAHDGLLPDGLRVAVCSSANQRLHRVALPVGTRNMQRRRPSLPSKHRTRQRQQ